MLAAYALLTVVIAGNPAESDLPKARKPAVARTVQVLAPQNAILAQQLGQPQQGAPRFGARFARQQPQGDYGQQLVELITTTIAPETWEVNGGYGRIVYFAPTRSLVVRQTAEAHNGLNQLIEALPR